MSRFDADFYQRFRPLYPKDLFAELPAWLGRAGFEPPFRLADIGCGTGHSTLSVLNAGVPARIVGVDPDPRMLEKARSLPGLQGAQAEFVEGTGERTGLADRSMDAVLVGSAFHWMDAEAAREEFLRVLRPRGVIQVFEYQFPKAAGLGELNEWIRREFNLRWKAPGQRPRGDFRQVTRALREDPRLEPLAERRPVMRLELGPEELHGLILSQSRVLHYEETLSGEERARFRLGLLPRLAGLLGGATAAFEFQLDLAAFRSVG